MSDSTLLYGQLLSFLRQHSIYCDLRHLKTLAWMVTALIFSGTLSLPEWEPFVPCRATQAQSIERRWSRFLQNVRVRVERLYVPIVLAALDGWEKQRLYIALDTTVLWNEYCMIHLSVVCCGRAVPFLWRVLEHKSASVAFEEYSPLLRKARWLLRRHSDVMLLADRGFANHQLLDWLKSSHWHWCIRSTNNVMLHRPKRCPMAIAKLWPPKGEAMFYHQVRLWDDGRLYCNLVLAKPHGVKDPWAVLTDEPPSLQTLWQYALRFRVEELFLDSKSGAFELEGSEIRSAEGLERLYLVVALALLFATTQGMAVQIAGLRRHVDPHWKRGLSYLKIGLRWLKGVVHKKRQLFEALPLLPKDPQPCFASKKERQEYYDKVWFSRIRNLRCAA